MSWSDAAIGSPRPLSEVACRRRFCGNGGRSMDGGGVICIKSFTKLHFRKWVKIWVCSSVKVVLILLDRFRVAPFLPLLYFPFHILPLSF